VLSAKKVERVKTKGRYADGMVPGLYLQVGARGAKSWLLRYEIDGRKRWMGLGSASVFNLKEARERARLQRQKIADKIDPLEVRRAERVKQAQAAARSLTFREAAQRYFDANASAWSNARHRDQFGSSLAQYVHPIIGTLDVASIDTADVLRCLEQPVPAGRGWPAGRFWDVRTKTADRTRRRVALVLDWCAVRGHRPPGAPNPARWRGHLSEALPAPGDVVQINHIRALPYVRVPELMTKLAAHQGTAARALMFTILTAARSNETLGAKWDEFDLKNAIWTVPASRMKNRQPHDVPLSAAAVALLRGLPREGDLVFVGGRKGAPLSGAAMPQVLERLGYGDVASPHGFRASFRTWGAERSHFPREVLEHALAHTVGDASERSYARSKLFGKRRLLMAAWARFCGFKKQRKSPPTQVGAKVVRLPIRARR
jgi:integrase